MAIESMGITGRAVFMWLLSFAVANVSAQDEASLQSRRPAASTSQCVVASVHPVATDAGTAAFAAGGNAVDAAIATALTLGVVDPHNSGIGGGCFILIRSPDGTITAIDGRETAPAAAASDMYVRDGVANPSLSTTGALAVAVPGALAAYQLALEKEGQGDLAALLRPAAEVAETGFSVDRMLAHAMKVKQQDLARFAGSRAELLREDGQPYEVGQVLKRPDLGKTYRAIADQGVEWFYEGPFALNVGRWMSENDGLLTARDFAGYRALERTAIRTRYHDFTVIGFPPPSSGGIHVAQMLNILEGFELASQWRENQATANHLIIEAMKLAFADRAHWLGDADFVMVPQGLVAKDYGRELATRIRSDQAGSVASHGDPLPFDKSTFGKHTTHIAVADSDGYWVAITATINTHFGSKVVVPGTGVVLNNEMDDFSSQPGVPNAFGLVGAANNAIEPGKRPLSSMSPTIVLGADGQPRMTVGAAGGPKIITQVLLAIIRHLDFQQPLGKALAAPRFHHQWRPQTLFFERTTDPELVLAWQALGHDLMPLLSAGVTQAIAVQEDGTLVGAHDPRVPGKVGYASRRQQTGE